MPLDTPGLKTAMKAAFDNVEAMCIAGSTKEEVRLQFANDLSSAIETYVKSGTVVIATGAVAVATTGTSTAQTGANPAPVNGSIE